MQNSEQKSQTFTSTCEIFLRKFHDLTKFYISVFPQVMPSFSFLEEFSVIRAKYKTAFSDLMHAAARTTGTDVRHILLILIGCRASLLKKCRRPAYFLSMITAGHFHI